MGGLEVRIIASGSTGNACLVGDGETQILLDAGVPIDAIKEATGHRLSELDWCLVSHEHTDHIRAADSLMRRGVNVLASRGTLESAGFLKKHRHRARVLTALEKISLGTFFATPFDVPHDAAEPFGYLLESAVTGDRLLYVTDAMYVKYRFKNLSHILIECNFDDETLDRSVDEGITQREGVGRLVRSHMSLKTVLEFLEANKSPKLRKVYALHLSGRNSDEEKIKEAIQAATGAEVVVA